MLADILQPNLRLVVCGTAVGAESARRRTYYAGQGNSFWRTLHRVGLTPELLTTDRDRELLQFGIGLTDIAKEKAGSDAILTAEDFDVPGFVARIERYEPRVVCFNGKGAAKIAFDRERVDYGLQQDRIASSVAFVAPSTSGSARGYWDETYWYEVAALAKSVGFRKND